MGPGCISQPDLFVVSLHAMMSALLSTQGESSKLLVDVTDSVSLPGHASFSKKLQFYSPSFMASSQEYEKKWMIDMFLSWFTFQEPMNSTFSGSNKWRELDESRARSMLTGALSGNRRNGSTLESSYKESPPLERKIVYCGRGRSHYDKDGNIDYVAMVRSYQTDFLALGRGDERRNAIIHTIAAQFEFRRWAAPAAGADSGGCGHWYAADKDWVHEKLRLALLDKKLPKHLAASTSFTKPLTVATDKPVVYCKGKGPAFRDPGNIEYHARIRVNGPKYHALATVKQRTKLIRAIAKRFTFVRPAANTNVESSMIQWEPAPMKFVCEKIRTALIQQKRIIKSTSSVGIEEEGSSKIADPTVVANGSLSGAVSSGEASELGLADAALLWYQKRLGGPRQQTVDNSVLKSLQFGHETGAYAILCGKDTPSRKNVGRTV
jgi:hypothetical protein